MLTTTESEIEQLRSKKVELVQTAERGLQVTQSAREKYDNLHSQV